MESKTSILCLVLFVSLLLLGALAFADAQHGEHPHGDEMHGDDKGHTDDEDRQHGQAPHGHMDAMDGQMIHGLHRHQKWVVPPPAYANKRSRRWTDAAAIARGKQIYQTNCMVCHGADGRGTGPAARSLAHPPADLTNHFHIKPGDGDAYLFWRVSEGGMVEPFKSMQSAMPPFKTVLSEEQRWDVLAYVHHQFHRSFKAETMPEAVTGEGKVIAVVPASQQLVVAHGNIKGFMDAMTMGYKVKPSSLLERLHAGDHIRFTINTRKQTIVDIEKLKP